MALFNRKPKAENEIPDDLKPYYAGNKAGWRRFVGPVLRGLLLVVVIGLLVAGGIWSVSKLINRSGNDSRQTAQSNKSNDDRRTDAADQDGAATNEDAGTTAPATPPAAQPSTPPAAQPSAPATPPQTPAPATTPAPSAPAAPAPAADQQLANTGPGETAAVIAATVFAGIFGFRYYLVRRSNK